MKLKHGKKYETADGVVYRVRKHPRLEYIWDINDDTDEHWDKNGKGYNEYPYLIRRHYTKPQPAHKLDLKPGDVVELVAWEDDSGAGIGATFECDKYGPFNGYYEFSQPKGQRPLFKVVSRVNSPTPAN